MDSNCDGDSSDRSGGTDVGGGGHEKIGDIHFCAYGINTKVRVQWVIFECPSAYENVAYVPL